MIGVMSNRCKVIQKGGEQLGNRFLHREKGTSEVLKP